MWVPAASGEVSATISVSVLLETTAVPPATSTDGVPLPKFFPLIVSVVPVIDSESMNTALFACACTRTAAADAANPRTNPSRSTR